jgi:phosphoenolpyruvate synthase/pyruvate phosphate dikinase
VVLDRVPNDIAMVSGVITAEFQTPLSHINILAKNRGTPNMAHKGAFDDPELRALDGELVRLEVTSQGFSVTRASAASAQAYWDSLRPATALVPEFDLSATELCDIGSLTASDSVIVGAKAANMGEMTRIGGGALGAIPLPEAPFAIPFARYAQHINESGVAALIDALLADVAEAPLAPAELTERLFAIRWAIFRAPASAALSAELAAEVRARWGEGRRIRFRSSTNAEDLAEFTGAGLYTSASATLTAGLAGEQAITGALKVVWASVWNEQAFLEREFYRVDHRRVQMGVLVHPAFTGEQANGVAITINEFNELRPAYYINSQVGEVSVTNATGQAAPEQILYYTWYEEPEYEVITRSSLLADPTDWPSGWPAGHAVLTDPELDELAGYLEAIHAHFRGVYQGGQNFAMDVEFKLAPGREVLIKQARPLKQKSF